MEAEDVSEVLEHVDGIVPRLQAQEPDDEEVHPAQQRPIASPEISLLEDFCTKILSVVMGGLQEHSRQGVLQES